MASYVPLVYIYVPLRRLRGFGDLRSGDLRSGDLRSGDLRACTLVIYVLVVCVPRASGDWTSAKAVSHRSTFGDPRVW